jgi:hypothetical protein
MTDVDGSGPIPRRSPRTSDGGAPVSGALAIVLAVVAVVAGFLILRSISGEDDRQLGVGDGGGVAAGGVDTGTATGAETTLPGGTSAPTVPTTTQPPDVFTGATVMVVNANFQSGTAGQMSRAIEGRGFTMVDPGDAALDQPLATSLIYYDTQQAAALEVANTLNRVLGGDVQVTALPDPANPPVKSGTINGAGVVLMLGTDKANKTLEELSGGGATGGGPAVVTNPPLDTATAGDTATASA